MSKIKTFYYFTNQRNLLQAITKGYLCNINYWDRKTDDFSEDISFPSKDYLCFSKKILDLPFSFDSDKTLTPVAIGIGEEKLNTLGFVKVNISDADIVYLGDEIIPVDLIDIILFKSQNDLSKVGQRYGDYLELLDPKIYAVSIKEFTPLINFTDKLGNKLPPLKLSGNIETHISKRIGAIGNYFIHLLEYDENKYLLYSDIVRFFLNCPSTANWEEVVSKIKSILPEWGIKDDEVLLIAAIFISNSVHGIDNQVNCIENFLNKVKIDEKGFNFDLLFTFISTLDSVLYSLNEEIKIIDRVELISKIEDKFKNDIKDRSLKGNDIKSIIKKIKGVFDYSTELKDVIEHIDLLKCNVLKLFIRGFELYIREPVNIDKIKIAGEQDDDLPSNLCAAVPSFIWGKARGSFAFAPLSKKDMLKKIGRRTLYSIAISKNEFEDLHFELLPKTEVQNTPDTEKLSLGDYEIYIKTSGPIDQVTYDEYEYEILTQSGLSLTAKKKDKYLDVLEHIHNILDKQLTIENRDIEYFFNQHFRSDIKLNLGSKDFTVGDKPILNIDKNLSLHYDGNIEIDIKIPRDFLINKLITFIKDKYSEFNFDRVSIDEKRNLRNHFSLLDHSNITESKKVIDVDPITIRPDQLSTKKAIMDYLDKNKISYKSRETKKQLLDRMYKENQEKMFKNL